jgi:hypothetical protein
MEGNCSTGQSPQWPVVPVEEEEKEEERILDPIQCTPSMYLDYVLS